MSVEEAPLGSAASCADGRASVGSSGMVSREMGRATLAVLLLLSLFGDLADAAVVGREAVEVGVRLLVGLAVLVREERVDGRLGGADVVAPPSVVRLVLSALGSVRVVFGLAPPRVGVVRDDGRLFSSPAADVPSSLLPAGLRSEEDAVGRVGGLLMVLPAVREERVLGRVVEGEVGVRAVVPMREDAAVGFLASSALAGGFAPGAVRRSIVDGWCFLEERRELEGWNIESWKIDATRAATSVGSSEAPILPIPSYHLQDP